MSVSDLELTSLKFPFNTALLNSTCFKRVLNEMDEVHKRSVYPLSAKCLVHVIKRTLSSVPAIS